MSDRNASKRKRAVQNKAARDALATRRTKVSQDRPGSGSTASAKTRRRRGLGLRPASTADAATGRPSRTAVGTPRRSSAAPETNRDHPAREAVERPVREPRTALGRGFAGIQRAPGGRPVLFGFLFSIVAAGMLLFAPISPRYVQRVPSQIVMQVRADQDLPVSAAAKEALEKPRVESTYLISQIGPAAGVVVFPVLIAGLAVFAARRPNRTRTFTLAAVGLLLFVLVLSSVGIFFLFSAGALGFGAYQSRRADGPGTGRTRRGRRRAGARDDEEDKIHEDGPDETDG